MENNLAITLAEKNFSVLDSKLSEIISESIHDVFNTIFDDVMSNDLFYLISDKLYCSQKDMFSNYDLFCKGIHLVFNSSAKNIITQIDSKIIEKLGVNKNNVLVSDALNSMRIHDLKRNIRELKQNNHVLLLFRNEQFRDMLVSEFFDSAKSCTCCVGDKDNKFHSKSISYEDLIENNSINTQKLTSFVDECTSINTTETSRISAVDNTWYMNNGLSTEIVNLESSLGVNLGKNQTMICPYNVSGLSEKEIDSLIESHGFVIDEDSHSIYCKEENN